MARLKEGIFGGFSGKVGNIIGSSCRGVDYIKSAPAKMTNPRTKSQTKQRSSFIITQNFLRTMIPIIRIGFKDYAIDGMSAFNAAMSYNMINGINKVKDGCVIDYTNVLISRGSLFPSPVINATVTDDLLQFEWNPILNENAKSTDQVMVIAHNAAKGESVFDVNAGKRGSAATFIVLPKEWKGDIIETYIAFKNEESTLVSDSCYTGQLVL